MIALQWIGGSLLGLVALVAFICFAGAVLACTEQPNLATVVISILIAFALMLITIAASVGAWALIMGAMGA